jgi:hypothetical protein
MYEKMLHSSSSHDTAGIRCATSVSNGVPSGCVPFSFEVPSDVAQAAARLLGQALRHDDVGIALEHAGATAALAGLGFLSRSRPPFSLATRFGLLELGNGTKNLANQPGSRRVLEEMIGRVGGNQCDAEFFSGSRGVSLERSDRERTCWHPGR